MTADDVVTAIDIADEEMARAVADVKDQAAEAVRGDDFTHARGLIDTADAMESIRRRLGGVRDQWRRLDVPRRPGVADAPGDATTAATDTGAGKRRYLGRVPRGQGTPEAAFYRPILEVLLEFGGAAHIQEVLDAVEHKLDGTLGEVDRRPLESDADMVRWRNTAQWARNELVRRGLMLGSRERAVWEISEEGRRWLKDDREGDRKDS